MPRPARVSSTALAALALALAGCGSSSPRVAQAPSPDSATPRAASAMTDGRVGPAVSATDSAGARTLSPGGRPDPSDPRRPGQRSDGIGATDSCPEVELIPTDDNLNRIASTTLCLLNGVRADDGLRPVALNAALARAARAHSRDMVANSYFAHEGRNGSHVQDRIGSTGYLPKYSHWIIGENLAWGTGALATPKAIVNAWMNSKGHRDNILKADYREIGLGIVSGNPSKTDGAGATYATEFGFRDGRRAKRARVSRVKRASAKRAVHSLAPRP